jgi:TonB-dependent starch-binding outer membrane protein SusC
MMYIIRQVFICPMAANGNFDNQTTNMLNAWKQPGDITNVPRIGAYYGSLASGGSYTNSSFWLYNGAFIRLKNLTLGYKLPQSISNALHISAARFYLSGTNLWITTKYPGDPEVNTATIAGGLGGSEDFYTIPQPRTITAGLNITF